ncbi:MAG: hypothetical protein ACUVTU_03540 [Desulfurispora sp.]|uniref:hypothetical protein n=1 Tax=Desulfurispora sp. TaxID=3014275 RepID=UPI004049ED1E
MASNFVDDIKTYENMDVVIAFGSWIIFGKVTAIQDDYLVLTNAETKHPVHMDVRYDSIHCIASIRREDFEVYRRIMVGLPVNQITAP